MMVRPKHQRLVLVLLALAALLGAVLLAMWGLKDRAAYFYTPSDIGSAAPGGGGMNPWPFVTAAYALTLLATAALVLLSWRSMRKAEAAAEQLRK